MIPDAQPYQPWPLPASQRRISAEHEAAHGIAAAALGLTVFRIDIDAWPAYCETEEGTPAQQAVIGAAGDVWIEEVSGLVLDFYDSSDGDWEKVLAIVGYEGLRAVRAEAVQLLSPRAAQVRAWADELERHGHLVHPVEE